MSGKSEWIDFTAGRNWLAVRKTLRVYRQRWNAMLNIIRRPVPHAVLSWRYLLPRQSPAVKLHRQVLLRAWPRFPRIVWFLIALCNYSLWYAFFSWRYMYRACRRHGATLRKKRGIVQRTQLVHLFELAWMHGIPPHFYYLYRLYDYPKDNWLDFIFTHELPQWHLVMSPKAARHSHAFLRDKQYFSQTLGEAGLPVIETLARYRNGQRVDESVLFQEKSLFLKPRQGSRQSGCYVLFYYPGEGYALVSTRVDDDDAGIPRAIHGKAAIVRAVTNLASHCQYIIQPLVRNHAWLSSYVELDYAISIRLVTAMIGHVATTVSATLEIPLPPGFRYVHPMPIDIDSGHLSLPLTISPAPETLDSPAKLAGQTLPAWMEMRRVAEQAHGFCPDIRSVGWDLALGERGVIVIEGNFNWVVSEHQLVDNGLIQCFYETF